MPTARIGESEIHYADLGQGRPFVLVHGFPLDHLMWQGQLEPLSKLCRVIAPDLRGFGRSTVSSGTVTMAEFAKDITALLDALAIQEPVILCGLSMGGYIAWQFWKQNRDRLAALILCDTRAAPDSAEAARGRLTSAEQVEKQGSAEFITTLIGKLFAPETAQAQPQVVEATRQTMLQTRPAGIAAALRGMAIRPDMTPELPSIDVPALVICGERDAISPPAEMRGIAQSLPNARFVEVPRAGHMSPLEQPEPVNREITNFVTGLS